MAAGDYFLSMGHILPTGERDVNANDQVAKARPGAITLVQDAHGFRVLKYVKALATVTRGSLVSKPGATDGIEEVDDITAGSTTSATTSGRTASDDVGKLCECYDNADSAGAAPEGEHSVIVANSATVLSMDQNLPFTVALAVNDDLALIGTYQAEASADGDFAHAVHGVVVGADGITDNYYGWVQIEGITKAKLKSEAMTKNGGLVADAGVLGVAASDGVELWCAVVLQDVKADQVADTGLVRLHLLVAAGTGGTP